ncbi:hypothetical protein C8R43DRAFT_962167 [Mycena crocata]|nr:hypothetical protein C8R43DRAFT_962167 [Mycena crocata]
MFSSRQTGHSLYVRPPPPGQLSAPTQSGNTNNNPPPSAPVFLSQKIMEYIPEMYASAPPAPPPAPAPRQYPTPRWANPGQQEEWMTPLPLPSRANHSQPASNTRRGHNHGHSQSGSNSGAPGSSSGGAYLTASRTRPGQHAPKHPQADPDRCHSHGKEMCTKCHTAQPIPWF